MTEDTGAASLRSLEYRLKRKSFWSGFDDWMRSDDEERRSKFGPVRSALLVHSGFNVILLTHTIRQVKQMLTGTPKEEIRNFMVLAGKSKMITGDAPADMTVFSVLAHIFACIPEYQDEEGPLSDGLLVHLKNLMSSQIDWTSMSFSVELFRSVYWQLVITLKLGEKSEDADENPMEPYKEQMAFACFVAAIVISMWNRNEHDLHCFVVGYERENSIERYLEMMISSTFFRNFSYVLITGFWFMVKNRKAGGFVTHSSSRPLPDERRKGGESDEEFRARCLQILPFRQGFDTVLEEGIHEKLILEWAAYVKGLTRSGMLLPPGGFRYLNKGGRPRKNVAAKRRSEQMAIAEDGSDALDARGPPAQKPKATPKKTASPTKRVQANRKMSRRELNAPGPSSAPVVPPKAPSPPPPPPLTADDVGLSDPVYIMQNNVMKKFRELILLRNREGAPENATEQIEEYLNSHYSDVHRVGELTLTTPTPILNADQKTVMENFKKSFTAAIIESTDSDNGLVAGSTRDKREERQAPLQASPSKGSTKNSTRRWKRRY